MKDALRAGMVVLLLAACGEETIVEEVPYPATVTVSPERVEFGKFRATAELKATVSDQNGRFMGTEKVTWSSEDADVAEVTDGGVVTAFGSGEIEIVATAGDVSGAAIVTVSLPQRDALLELYESLNGDSWTENDNWSTKTELRRWFGVEANRDGNVTKLTLDNNNLSGELPSGMARLEHLVELEITFNDSVTGTIPPEIGELQNLRALRLHHNGLSGPPPSELANLTELRHLDLHHNPLTGPVPEWFGDLSELVEITIWGTAFTGPLPASLGNLAKLEQLSIIRNPGLSGPLPRSMMNLEELILFWWDDTNLCSPADEEFQDWLRTILRHSPGAKCDS